MELLRRDDPSLEVDAGGPGPPVPSAGGSTRLQGTLAAALQPPMSPASFQGEAASRESQPALASEACLKNCKDHSASTCTRHRPASLSPERGDRNRSHMVHSQGLISKVMKWELKNTENCSWMTETPQWWPTKHSLSSGNPYHMPALSRRLFFFFQLKCSWFTVLCQSLLASKVTQFHTYMHFLKYSFPLWFVAD